MIRIRDQQGALVVKHRFGLFEGNAMLLGIRCRLAGIPLKRDFYKAAFFSGSTYTTLGYGEELLPGSWDTITVMIALSGMFSIAWTTSSLIAMIGIFHPLRLRRPKDGKEPKDVRVYLPGRRVLLPFRRDFWCCDR